jgi:putative lipase involved disintegration of autophagic bodies
MLLATLISQCLALETRFKLVNQFKAIHTGSETGLFINPSISTLDQQWTAPFRYTTTLNPLYVQELFQSTVKGSTTVPDHTDHQTVLNFAKLTYNAYSEPTDKNWMAVPGWNVSARFGWENTGIRGYLFEDELQSSLIIVIKGTSLATPVGGGPTARLDKLNVSKVN